MPHENKDFGLTHLRENMETECITSVKELEEGEINDDSFEEIYIPLERPDKVTPLVNKVNVESDVDDNGRASSTDNDCDSDSSNDGANLPKIRRKMTSSSSNMQKSKKNNHKIWCTVLEAEAIASNLTNCNIDESQDRIRGLVPYDYSKKNFSKHGKRINYSELCRGKKFDSCGKRNYDGYYVGNKKCFKDTPNNNLKCLNSASKDILPLSENARDSKEKLAKEIATKLNEAKENLVLRAVEIAGKDVVISIFEETRTIEKSGGMLVMNGSRRRSPGGVFFYLLKTSEEIPNEKQKLIFLYDKRDTSLMKKKTAKQIKEFRSAKLKEALSKDDFPTLLSRTELAIRQYKERKKAEESSEVENPPPSPVTDGRDCSSDSEEKFGNSRYADPTKVRNLITYGDNLFGGFEDNMDDL